MVQRGPDGPKRVPNCQKHLGFPFLIPLDPVGSLWNVDKPAMFGHFFCFIGAFFLGKMPSRQDQTLPDKPGQTAERPMVTQTFAQFALGRLITKIMFYFFWESSLLLADMN